MNTKGCLLHRDASEDEIEHVKELLKIPITCGTVNMGSPFVNSGIICNSNGFVVGDLSGGPETMTIDEALGFLER